MILLRQQSYAMKNQLSCFFCLLLTDSLWHNDIWLPCTERSYYRRPFAVKNQREGGFGCDELVLYGIRLLAKQILGSILDLEVDQSDVRSPGSLLAGSDGLRGLLVPGPAAQLGVRVRQHGNICWRSGRDRAGLGSPAVLWLEVGRTAALPPDPGRQSPGQSPPLLPTRGRPHRPWQDGRARQPADQGGPEDGVSAESGSGKDPVCFPLHKSFTPPPLFETQVRS